MLHDPHRLQRLTDFENLLDFLRDDLDWPIEAEDLKEATFDYNAQELNINLEYAAKIASIKQLRPLVENQVWGIFFVEFDSNRLPVMVLRRILQSLAVSQRQRDASLPAWKREDLLFICIYTSAAENKIGQRSIAFAHFREQKDKQPELRTFSWDSRETHFYYIRNLNLAALRWPIDETDVEAWRLQWRRAFAVRHRYTIRTAEKLASQMAQQAVVIRELIDDLYDAEDSGGALHLLYDRMRIDLIHDLSLADFADMIAQTITYGVFSAAVQNQDITLETLADFIPDTNRFLKEMLSTLTTEGELDLSELGVGQLVDLLYQVDLQAILRDFGRQTASGREDPVVHFYEQFLNEYDQEQKVQRGVFYTPDPVVEYIVKAVDQILKRPMEEGGFALADGLASEATTTNGKPLVQILDPATGTGTFLAHVIDHITRQKNPRGHISNEWDAYVAQNLLPRLNGFELMMAPYTIAHLKLGLKLANTGYSFGTGERLRVFLTNALEKPLELKDTLLATDYLSREANEASVVKKHVPIMVVIGNPPYSGHSANQLPEDWFGHDDYFQVDGKPLGERNPKWLQDDYVKFIRFGQWRISQSGEGILAFITNNGYLDSPTFRGMRQQLLLEFDEIYIIDLHGNSRKREVAPDGGKDENVFDIMQGVAINIFVKHQSKNGNEIARVYHCDLWGLRDYKYDWLLTYGGVFHKSEGWSKLEPQSPFYLFVPQDTEVILEFQQGWKITDVFPTNSLGVATARDSLTVGWSPKEIKETVHQFAKLETEAAREEFNLGRDSRDWKVGLAQQDVKQNLREGYERFASKILYRPFDMRFTFYTGQSRGFMCMPRQNIMQHMVGKNNLALITARNLEIDREYDQFLVTNTISQLHTLSIKEVNYHLPLYTYPDKATLFDISEWPLSEYGRYPNLSKAFVAQCSQKLGLNFVTDGRGDLHNTFGPEDVFHYAYAIFHSHTYRKRYSEQLKIDFPRLPLTTDVELFRQLVMRGLDLVALHLLEDDYPGNYWQRHKQPSPLTQPITRFVSGKNGTQMGASSISKAFDPQKKRIYLDTTNIKSGSYFEFRDNINAQEAQETWEFQIGGYQVLHKWLYDRRARGSDAGRILTEEDIVHYQRTVAALHLTRKLMDEVDELIDEHGGFPLPGSGPEDADAQPLEKDEMIKDELDFPGEKLFEIVEKASTESAGVLYEEGDDPEGSISDENEISDISNPFEDPSLIRVETRQMSLDTIINRMRFGEINLNPDFQRMAGIWNRKKQSLLIESLLIRIPLPAFYIDASNDKKWLVIDGLQRFTSIYNFVLEKDLNKQLKLQYLEFLSNELKIYDDADKRMDTWEKLPRHFQRRISETPITLNLLQPGTPDNVKFIIFKRINTGGVPLSGQEIRNALNLGKSTALLNELAESVPFKRATDNSVSSIRMTDRELALRFLAFAMKDYREYRESDLDAFLNERMADINKMSDSEIETYKKRFDTTMIRARQIFGEHPSSSNQAFRKRPKNGQRSPISKALFEAWSVNLDALSEAEFQKLFQHKKELDTKFVELLSDPEFDRAISYSTGNVKRVQNRFGSIERIIREVLND